MQIKTIVTLFIAIILLSCTAKEESAGVLKTIPVKLVDIQQKEISRPIYTSGVLTAKDELLLSFKTGGIVKNIYVIEGQTVKSGQLLAQLDLAEISAYKEQARAGLEKAERDYKRIENLYQEKVATLEQKQNAHSALQVAKANLQVADFNEKHSKIIAPANGKVLKTFIEASELIGPGNPVLAFGSTEKAFILKTGVTDKDVVRIQKGDPAEINFDAYPDITFPAVITEISGTSTPGSGTYEVQLQLDKKQDVLFSGFIGKATIYPRQKQKVSVLPVNALNEADKNTGYVYIVDEKNMAHKESIRIAFIMDNQVAFYNDTNLKRVINEGNAYLFEKSPVEIID